MALTQPELEAIVNRAFPGERLAESRALGDDRYALALPGGERLTVQIYGSAEEAATATAALRLLRAEVDLPIPQLRASDPEAETIGRPYVLLSELSGEPLDQALPRLGEEQLYTLGRKLGETVCRVHRLICERYGALVGDDTDTAADERSYGLARLERELEQCSALGILDRRIAAEAHDWFDRGFQPVGRQAALVCGGLAPSTILVRQSENRWWISGLLGWEHALGWSPAWEHVTFFDATHSPRYFSLRVGYGNGYDDQTSRPYEQVREHALVPYRILLTLQGMRLAYAHGDRAERTRRREILKGLMRAVERPTTNDQRPTTNDEP
ncbi:MAG TPA: phosphotransferase [Roseiflexaceae bacterium]|nr:phosphotransferase [Roseiflexaceae bacterium]